MSNLVFPTGQLGVQLVSNRTPIFKTSVQDAQSGKQTRIARMAAPLFKFELAYEVLRDDLATSDLKTIVGFFNALKGRYDTFLYTDPYWSTVTAMQFGTGDGTTRAFQLTATNSNSGGNGIAELIQNVNGTPSIYVNGTLQTITTNYTISSTGVVTFVSAPAAAAVLTWTGSFYYRCTFTHDELSLTEILKKWWQLKKLEFQSVKL
jgi:uncharacterized protein (TIGR02217 family)